MRRHFIMIEGQVLHFRMMGKGMPLVLLHASPSSSAMMMPLMQQLSDHYCVIAPDIPACGLSQPLEKDFRSINAYAAFFHQFFQALSLPKVALYGTATGAQIAIRYALEYPDHVAHLYLDNAAHFSDEQRQKILESYFPDLAPQYDGSHLMRLWTMVHDMFLFFPWCWAEPAYRLQSPFPPASVLKMVALDFLQAGREYDRAYRAAFAHEQAQHVQALQVPTQLFNWAGSIIQPYIQQLIQYPMPESLSVLDIAADRSERMRAMVKHIRASYLNGMAPQAAIPISSKATEQGFIDLPDGRLHYFAKGSDRAKALLVLHDWKQSAALVFQQYSAVLPEQSLIAISLPNHGESDSFPLSLDIPTMGKRIGQAIDRLDIEIGQVCGQGWSDDLARWLAEQHPALQYIAAKMPVYAPLPDLEPDAAGVFLIKGWHFLRDRYWFKDPEQQNLAGSIDTYPKIDPEMLQLALREWLKFRTPDVNS